MTAFVLSISVLNLAVGYGLAVALARPLHPHIGLPRFSLQGLLHGLSPRALLARFRRRSGAAEHHIVETPTADDPNATIVEPAPLLAPHQHLPKPWLEELAAADIVVETLIEALLQSLQLEAARYREQLLLIDSRLRHCRASRDAADFDQVVSDLAMINDDWLRRERAVAKFLQQRRGQLADEQPIGDRFEQLLAEQSAEIAELSAEANRLRGDDLETSERELGRRLGRMLDLAHTLRDQMHDWTAVRLRAQQRIRTTPDSRQYDAATGLHNRTGIETLFEDWHVEDPSQLRLLSCALIDVDACGKFNERFGPRAGDRVLQSIGQTLNDLVRKDRGFDRLARVGGQTFFVLFGDVGPRNASRAVERIRQAVEATTFEFQGNKFEATLSCGVGEVNPSESIDAVLTRLRLAVVAAKRAGRNRTTMDEGDGAQLVDPTPVQVESRVIEINLSDAELIAA